MIRKILGYIKTIKQKSYLKQLSNQSNINVSPSLRIVGIPMIDIHQKATLEIGKNVTLGSENRGYHLNLFAPTKLLADREGATIKIGDNCRIHGTCIHAQKYIEIGKNCLIAANCQIIDCNAHNVSFDNVENRIHTKGTPKPIIIKDNVWLGANTFVMPGVTIGEGSVISANSVVTEDIPPYSIARGNPAIVTISKTTKTNQKK